MCDFPFFPETLYQQPLCKEEVPPERHVGSSSLVQEEQEPPPIKEEQDELLLIPHELLTLLPVKCEDDVENKETEPVASNLTQRIETQAENCGTQPDTDNELLSSHCSESDITEDRGDWEETREGQSAITKSNLKSHD